MTVTTTNKCCGNKGWNNNGKYIRNIEGQACAMEHSFSLVLNIYLEPEDTVVMIQVTGMLANRR